MMLAKPEPAPRPIALVPVGPRAEGESLRLAEQLRERDFAVDLGYRGNVSRRMKQANKVGECLLPAQPHSLTA